MIEDKFYNIRQDVMYVREILNEGLTQYPDSKKLNLVRKRFEEYDADNDDTTGVEKDKNELPNCDSQIEEDGTENVDTTGKDNESDSPASDVRRTLGTSLTEVLGGYTVNDEIGFGTELPDENQILLKVPRQNNMYSFNLENIVPLGDLACLIAKATTDESNLWHRRLGHVNFKNLNRLVKGNLVRGLPSKLFQNDHTCVACQKGKQHKASCKAKLVSSISHPLQLLHMDLFGPTSVRSLNHKTYCLVITDDFSRFSWTFFLRTKDETSAILKDFIRQIENQLNQKVKTIRCDNGTEFKNRDMIEFCGLKGIKREYSNARTPQQNGVAERKNRTLIEAARTMLADSFLPNTFWAEAVSTACYVLNRVLVTKPHNKTPYELLTGKIPIISYIRPFGCHVTILNTIDHLGKFAGKSDEGFLVGYSLQSKAFRVYNLQTRRVKENLHITFLENKPNVAGKGPTWLFDLDYLTDSMNNHSVRSENQANPHADDKRGAPREEEQVFLDDLARLERQEKEASEEAEALRQQFAQESENLATQTGVANSSGTNIFSTVSTTAKASGTNFVNTVGIPASTACPNEGLSLSEATNSQEDDNEISQHEGIYQDTSIFTTSSFDDEGAVADFTNLETVVNISNKKAKSIQVLELMLLLAMFKSKRELTIRDFHHCLFACFLSQHEPKKILEALEDESWVDAMQEELLQFEIQKVWVLVDLPYGKEGYRLEPIRIFYGPFASYMGFIVYQMDVKSAFLYGKIDEEVYVSQPPGFLDPKHPQKVYKSLSKLSMSTQAGFPEPVSSFDLESYSDSDYAGANLDRKSTTGGCQFLQETHFLAMQEADHLGLLVVRGSKRRVTDSTAALLLLTLFILWWTNKMAVLDSCPKHNMVAYLEKSEGNVEFHEIIDFLKRSSIHHALTVIPVVSTTFVEQFWTSAKSKTINNVRHITANVAGSNFDAIQQIDHPEALPTPSPAPTSEVPYEPQTDSSPAHTSETSGENLRSHSSSDKSLSGNEGDMTIQGVYDLCLSLCKQVSDQAKEIQALKAQITKLKKQAKPVAQKSLISKPREEDVQKGEHQFKEILCYDVMPEYTIDHRKQKCSISTDKEGVSTDFEKVSTDRPIVSTDGSKVSTDEQVEGTEEQNKGTEEIFEGTEEQREGTEEKVESTDGQIKDDETIATLLLNMSQAKAASKEKEKGVELKDVEETDRPRPTSIRSLLTLKPLLKIDPKNKGKKKIEEEDESESESDGIPQAEKKFKQLERDEELARKVQEEWEEEEERNRVAEEQAANEELIKDFDDIKARIEADRLLAEKLQEQEKTISIIEERAKFLHDIIAAQRKFLAQQRSKALRNKPPTKNQLRNQMMTYLKHIKRSDEDFISIGSAEDERLIKRMNEKGVDLSKSEVIKEESKEEVQEENKDEESTRKRKLGTRKKMKSRKRRYIQNTSEDDSDKENDELRLHLTIVPDEEKEPKTDQAEHLEEINLNVVIRSNGQKRYFSTLMTVLSIFDREDLNAVYQLVMEKYQDEMPEGFDRVLWGDLMVMFNSDDKDEFWISQLDWKIVSWKLHGSSGVHTLVTDTENTMALELIKFVKKILAELESEEHKNWLVHKQTDCGKDFSNPFMVDNLPKIVGFSTHLASVERVCYLAIILHRLQRSIRLGTHKYCQLIRPAVGAGGGQMLKIDRMSSNKADGRPLVKISAYWKREEGRQLGRGYALWGQVGCGEVRRRKAYVQRIDTRVEMMVSWTSYEHLNGIEVAVITFDCKVSVEKKPEWFGKALCIESWSMMSDVCQSLSGNQLLSLDCCRGTIFSQNTALNLTGQCCDEFDIDDRGLTAVSNVICIADVAGLEHAVCVQRHFDVHHDQNSLKHLFSEYCPIDRLELVLLSHLVSDIAFEPFGGFTFNLCCARGECLSVGTLLDKLS
ncbi:putative ribonuclease H-like domain-containing protein [Tanacetum coccineum]